MVGAVGPVAGGFVVAHASWRWVFVFNVPVAIAIVALARHGVDETRDEAAPKRMDAPGAALATLGLGAIVYALIDDGARAGARGEAWLLAAGGALFVAFVVVESRTREPMVPLPLFRARSFSGTNVVTLFLYGAIGGEFFFLPFNLIFVQHYDAGEAGAALLPMVVLVSILSPTTEALSARLGVRTLRVAGPRMVAGGFALLALPGAGGSYWTTFFPGIVVLGLGMGITVAPLTATVMSSVETHRAGLASGVNNAIARAAGLLAIAALGAALRARFDRVLEAKLATLHLTNALSTRVAAERTKLAAADFGDLDANTRAALRAAFDAAYVAGFRTITLACASMAALAAAAALISIPPRARP